MPPETRRYKKGVDEEVGGLGEPDQKTALGEDALSYLRPLFLASSLIGLSPLPSKFRLLGPLLLLLSLAAFLSSQPQLFRHAVSTMGIHGNIASMGAFVAYGNFVFSNMARGSCVLVFLRCRRKLGMVLKRVARLQSSLRLLHLLSSPPLSGFPSKERRGLPAAGNCRAIVAVQLACLLAFSIALLMAAVKRWVDRGSNVLHAISFVYFNLAFTILGAVAFNALRLLEDGFSLLNSVIEERTKSSSVVTPLLRRLSSHRLSLRHAATELDEIFGPQIIVYAILGLLHLTSFLYYVIDELLGSKANDNGATVVSTWLMIILPEDILLGMTCYVCHRIVSKLCLFSTQIMHNRVRFCARGFIDVDLSLLTSILGTLVTYTVILVQFGREES